MGESLRVAEDVPQNEAAKQILGRFLFGNNNLHFGGQENENRIYNSG